MAIASRNESDARSPTGTRRPADTRVGKAALAVSLVVLAALAAIDLVRSDPPDLPMVQPTFDVAPPDGWTTPVHESGGADESARGTRPDFAH